MAKLILKKRNPIDVVNRLIGVIHSTDDIIEIFNEANQQIARQVKCDQLNILLNNEKARYFYINHALNYNNRETTGEDIIIPYNETSFTEILHSQRSSIRNDLTGKGILTPGDLKLLAKKIKSDISIPIMNRNGIAGIINLGSHQTSYFTKSHQKFVEQVAALLGFALERSQLNEKINQKKAELQSWEKKFTCLMQNSGEAVAIVRSDYDLIYEANTAFQQLTGYSSEQLQGMRLSLLHPTYGEVINSKLQADASNGKAADLIELPLLKKNGDQVTVQLRFSTPKELDKDLVFAIYRHTEPGLNQSKEAVISSNFITRLFESSKQEDIEEVFAEFLQEIYPKLEFKYAALKIIDPDSKKIETLKVRKFPGNSACEDYKLWQSLLNQAIFADVIEKNKTQIIRKASSREEDSPWTLLAQKLAVQAFFAAPISFHREQCGLVSFFYEKEKHLTDVELDYLSGAGTLLALFLRQIYLIKRNKDRQLQYFVMQDIQKLSNSDYEPAEISKKSLVSISTIVPFDFAELSLFDTTGEHVQTFAMVSENGRMLNPKAEWRNIADSELYWCDIEHKNLRQNFEHREVTSQEAEKLLRSSIPTVIMQQDKYLGTLVIGSLKSNVYTQEQRKFIETAAQQIGLVLQNRSADHGKCEKEKNYFDHAESIGMIGSSLDLDMVLSHIVATGSAIMQAQLATIRLVADNSPSSELIVTNSAIDTSAISDFEKNHILPGILINNVPFLHESGFSDKVKKFDAKNLAELKTFFSVPIKFEKTTLAILTYYWSSRHEIQVDELNFISAIAGQSARAIENAKLHQDLQDALFQIKTKYAELENLVNHISEGMANPVASIQGMISTLQSESFSLRNEMGAEHLAHIKSNIDKIQRYANDFQGFCKIYQYSNSSSYEEVNIGDVISRVSSELIDKLNEKKIRLVIENAMPSIKCNNDWMVQVFFGLIENAINCFNQPMRHPKIEVGHQNVNGDHQFYIRDNGSGLSKENQVGIFDLYYDGSSGESQANARLPLVKRIIESHKGEIWVDSEEGKGSTFYFTLPRRQS